MTGEQYREAIAKLGLSQVAAARFLQVSERQGRRFAASGPWPMVAVLLDLMVKGGISAVEAYRIAGLDPGTIQGTPHPRAAGKENAHV